MTNKATTTPLSGLPPAAALAVVLSFRGSELCICAGKLEVIRDRAGRLAMTREVTQHVAAVGVAVMAFKAEYAAEPDEETVQ